MKIEFLRKESAIGWGRLLETAIAASETLQQVLLVITEGQQCDRIKSGSQITTQLCAGSIDPKLSRDTCQGDRYEIKINVKLCSFLFFILVVVH